MLCTSDTPEGEACGLVKNLALMTHVTTDSDPMPIIRLAFGLGVEDVNVLSGLEISCISAYRVYINGRLLGIHRHPDRFISSVRLLRRSNRINEFVSISCKSDHFEIHISTDSGRICRPMIVVDSNTGLPLVTETILKQIKTGQLAFSDLLQLGVVEYLDVNEENDCLIAVYEREIEKGLTTHLEIEPFTVLGAVAGLIPYPHHNQSPRNTYQCAMGKQAMGAIAYNQLNRFDTLLYLLLYPQQPLVKTKTIELINYDKLPAGQNAIIAVMSYSGYDIEDALILNKSSLDRGFGRCTVLKKFQSYIKQYNATTYDRLLRPSADSSGALPKKFEILEEDGLAGVGCQIESGQIYINRQEPINKRNDPSAAQTASIAQEYRSAPLTFKSSEPAVIDKVR
jgi:DNA-directed RNA polymerase III subunit RPC2